MERYGKYQPIGEGDVNKIQAQHPTAKHAKASLITMSITNCQID